MAYSFSIELAGLRIQVQALHREVGELCRDYLGGEGQEPHIRVRMTRELIERERELDQLGGFADSYYETLAVYRAIAEQLPLHGRLLAHASAVAIRGRAFAFMAKSGTGKSTHSRWWRTVFASEQPYMVNDDKPIIQIEPERVLVWGTPWNGKEHLSTNAQAVLAGIGMLERGEEDAAERLDARAAMVQLMSHIYRPQAPEAARATLALVSRLAQQVPAYRVRATNTAKAALVSYEAMAGSQQEGDS